MSASTFAQLFAMIGTAALLAVPWIIHLHPRQWIRISCYAATALLLSAGAAAWLGLESELIAIRPSNIWLILAICLLPPVSAFLNHSRNPKPSLAPTHSRSKPPSPEPLDAAGSLAKLRQTEQDLCRCEERYKLIFDAASDAICVIDPASEEILDVNQTFCKLFECEAAAVYRVNEISSHPVLDVLRGGEILAAMKRTEREFPTAIDAKLISFKGREFWTEITFKRVTANQRERVIAVIRDVTEQRVAEQDRRALEYQLRSVIDNAPIVLWAVDENGLFTLSEGWGLKYLNLTPKQVIGISVYEMYQDVPKILTMIRQGLRGEAGHIEFEAGGRVWATTFTPRHDERNRVVGVLGTSFDVTEIKEAERERAQLENQLQHRQRLETVGTLAGGIAHDFNNILTPILGYAELAMSELPEGSPTRDDLEQVVKGATRARDLVNQILTFSRQGDRKQLPLYLHPIVKEVLDLLRATLPKRIEIRRNVCENCGAVLADPAQIHQVIMNLCTNAFQAIGEGGGEIEVSLDLVRRGEDALRRFPALTAERYLRLRVKDSGEGMSPATMERIFEPFFTTKDVGKGTGLGLAVAHGIVRAHGGEIAVASEPGSGTEFTVLFPQISIDNRQQESEEALVRGGGERILLIDDEADIVEVLDRQLTYCGYSVVGLTNSYRALQTFCDNPDGFDAVLTDHSMPLYGGERIAREVRSRRADIPIVMMSGFLEELEPERMAELRVSEFVKKPVSLAVLCDALGRALGKQAASSSSTAKRASAALPSASP